MTDFRRIAKAGALALAALVLFVPVLLGLNALGAVNESHCRSESGRMFSALFDFSGEMVLQGGTGAEVGQCILPRYLALDGWDFPGGEYADLSAAVPSTQDPDNLVLPVGYVWVRDGYPIAANSLAGRVLPILLPFMALLFLLAGFGTAWRQWNQPGQEDA